MTLTLTIFIVSFLAMAGMVGVALYKGKRGKEAIVFERRYRMETILHKSVNGVKRTSRMVNRRNTGLLFHAVVDTIEAGFLKLRDVIQKKVNQFLEKVRGQIRK